jgi:hypothetical protein
LFVLASSAKSKRFVSASSFDDNQVEPGRERTSPAGGLGKVQSNVGMCTDQFKGGCDGDGNDEGDAEAEVNQHHPTDAVWALPLPSLHSCHTSVSFPLALDFDGTAARAKLASY